MNKVYELTDKYYKLDEEGKNLISYIIKFCEEENKFPNEKDMTDKSGYISRTRFLKYFNAKSFKVVYDYIKPVVDKKPEYYKCGRCGKEKPFTTDYFQYDKDSKYKLKKICIKCYSQARLINRLKSNCKKYNIPIESMYDPISWYKCILDNKIKIMPKFCYTKENSKKIIRYVALDKLKIKNIYELINNFKRNQFEEYEIDQTIINVFNGKINCFKFCFPEFNIQYQDSNVYVSDEYINYIIKKWIEEYNIEVIDMLNGGITMKFNDEIAALNAAKFNNNKNFMFLWYFQYNNILHPIKKTKITDYDFQRKHNNYWSKKENRVYYIKEYCENTCDVNIKTIYNNTEELKKWIYENFRMDIISKIIPTYHKHSNLYDILTEAYPHIKNNHILFEWEWHQYEKNSKDDLIRMLREFVLHRMKGVINDLKNDIPIYMNINNMTNTFPKLNKQLSKRRFESYYEWCSLAFPEYANEWSKSDFGNIISYDGSEFDSHQEKDVYEFIKRDLGIQYIKSTCRNKEVGKYSFILGDDYDYNYFRPDFIIEYINSNNKKTKLRKPIIIEYYGMYIENNNHHIFKSYREKTLVKEDFYNSNKDIFYVGVYPQDTKDNYLGLTNKIKNLQEDIKIQLIA